MLTFLGAMAVLASLASHFRTACRSIQVRPYPLPLGKDGKLPLLSSVADIFHSTSAHTGTVVKNNYLVNSGEPSQCNRCSSACGVLTFTERMETQAGVRR